MNTPHAVGTIQVPGNMQVQDSGLTVVGLNAHLSPSSQRLRPPVLPQRPDPHQQESSLPRGPNCCIPHNEQ